MDKQSSQRFAVEAGAGDAGDRLDRWLSRRLPDLSRSRIQSLIRSGHITAGGAALDPSSKVKPGLRVDVVVPAPEPVDTLPEDIPLEILYEDSSVVCVNKPPGLVVHPAPGHPTGTLVNALLHHCSDLSGVGDALRPGIVHRLDRDTSGVLVVAKSEAAMMSLSRQFRDRTLKKMYLALVHGAPPRRAAVIRSEIGRSPRDRKKMAANVRGGRQSESAYELVEQVGPVALLRIGIATGRTHQIRVHMAHIGCPVVGDPQYGRPALDRKLPVVPTRQMLHAAELEFAHPVDGRALCVQAPLPADFIRVRDAVRGLQGDTPRSR